jgi:ADP-ribose pyrophosphatase YjhB (NUDIX family)
VTRPELAVGAIVVVCDSLLLVQRRLPPAAGRWSVPGGRVEVGETLADAVAREVREETGVEVSVGALAGVAERISADHHFVILDFVADVVGGGRPEPVAGDDAAAAAWIPVVDLPGLDLVDGLLDFLRAVGTVGP